MRLVCGVALVMVGAVGCDCGPHAVLDAGPPDAGPLDAGRSDAGPVDAGPPDAGPLDAGPPDAGPSDAGICGDHVTQSFESCDDGNRDSGDGCAGNCSGVEVGWACPSDAGPCRYLVVCGDAKVELDEYCDDGAHDAGDGCDDLCRLESGWRCPIPGRGCEALVCGDGLRRGHEDCDDANTAPGDGCDSSCRVEPGYACPPSGGPCNVAMCGDLSLHPTESCDDGNFDFDDGCTPICTAEPDCRTATCFSRCGDRIFQADAGEQCDDGDLRNDDGCTSTCLIEPGYTCTLAQPAALTLPIVLRDFHNTHPDFETFTGDDTGIVLPTLGTDGKPVYALSDGGHSPTTTGKAQFDQWYRDVPGVNVTQRQQLALRPVDGGLEFGNNTFFPLDGKGFGNEGMANNFHFTTETRFWFIWTGGEQMQFLGDDDVFIFINGHLVVNLGGIHVARAGGSVLDASAGAALGMTLGGLYEVALFHAERHSVGSSFFLTLSGFNFELSRCTRTCGDAVVDGNEECDDGVNDGGYARCSRKCQWDQWCGDGIVQSGFEQCDNGVNAALYDGGCAPSCQRSHVCGDGFIDSRFGEECDDGNALALDGCSSCRIDR